MNLTLTNLEYRADGIFGEMTDEIGSFVCATLQHAYDSGLGNGTFVPKVAAGTYICRRHAPNRLAYETFELQNVPDFQGTPVTGILIHKGNYDKDSEGCILIGADISKQTDAWMITSSAPTFNQFMKRQTNIHEFTLTIKDTV